MNEQWFYLGLANKGAAEGNGVWEETTVKEMYREEGMVSLVGNYLHALGWPYFWLLKKDDIQYGTS